MDIRFRFFQILMAIKAWYRGKYGFEVVGDLDLRPDVQFVGFKKILNSIADIDQNLSKRLLLELRDLETSLRRHGRKESGIEVLEGGYFLWGDDAMLDCISDSNIASAMKKLRDQFSFHRAIIQREFVVRFPGNPGNSIHFLVIQMESSCWSAFYDQLRFFAYFNKIPLLTKSITAWGRKSPAMMSIWV